MARKTKRELTLLKERVEERLRDMQSLISNEEVFELYYAYEQAMKSLYQRTNQNLSICALEKALNHFFNKYIANAKLLMQDYHRRVFRGILDTTE